MRRRRSGQRGTRRFGGRYYLLAGRGSKQDLLEREVPAARRRWAYIRVVAAGPHGRLVDDWMLYVFEEKHPELDKPKGGQA